MADRPTDPKRKQDPPSGRIPNPNKKPESVRLSAKKPLPEPRPGGATTIAEKMGEAAIRLGWLTPEKLGEAINEQATSALTGAKMDSLEDIFLRNKWLEKDQIAYLNTMVHDFPTAADGVPKVGRYEIRGLIGIGGMAKIFRAWDPKLKRDVALKVPNAASMKRWEREARAVAKLTHPNIISVYDVGDEAELKYMAMELIEGTELHNVWHEWPLRRRIEVLRSVAAAIGYAHKAGVIHRDLKPENVMVPKEGDIKVVDFGLARVAGEHSVTMAGTMVGSPIYMAPEQVRGEAGGVGIDIYALGIMLYEALTDTTPFNASNVTAIYERILRDEPAKPSLRKPTVPADLEVLALKALEKDPHRRFQSAQEFGNELERWLRGEPIRSRPRSFAVKALLKVKRNPWAWAGMVGMIVIAVGAFLAIRNVQGGASPANDLAKEAALAYSSGDLATARKKAAEALAVSPGHAEARYWHGRVLLRDYQVRRGVPEVRIAQGLVYVLPPPSETKEQRDIRKEIRAAFEGSTGRGFAEGVLAMWDGRYDIALATFTKLAAESGPTSWEAKVFEAQCFYYLLRFDEAEQRLKALLGLDPRLVDLTWGRLMIARALQVHLVGKDPAEFFNLADAAGTRLEQAGEVELGNLLRARTLIEWGLIDHQLGREPEARLDRGQRLIERNETPEAWVARGDALMVRIAQSKSHGKIEQENPREFREAIDTYSKAIAARPDFSHAFALRAEAWRMWLRHQEDFGRPLETQLDHAIDDFTKALSFDADYAEAALGLAAMECRKRRGDLIDTEKTIAAYRAEIDAISDVIRKQPKYAPAYLKRSDARNGLAEYRRGKGQDGIPDYDEAIKDLETALKIAPTYVDALLALSGTYRTLGMCHRNLTQDPKPDYEKAGAALDTALTINAQNAAVYAGYGELNRSMSMYPSTGDTTLGAHYEDGIKAMTEAIRLRPDSSGHYMGRAYLYRDYGAAVRNDPAHAQEAYAAAVSDLEICVKLNPMNVDAYRVMAMTHQRLAGIASQAGKDPLPLIKQAIDDCDQAIRTDPYYAARSAGVHMIRGNCYRELGEAYGQQGRDPLPPYQAAIESHSKSLEINPNYADTYRLRAETLFSMGRHKAQRGEDVHAELDGAMADYTKTIELLGVAASGSGFYRDRAVLNFFYGEWKEARGEDATPQHKSVVEDASSVMKNNPKYFNAYFYRGQTYLKLALGQMRNQKDGMVELQGAITDFKAGLELDRSHLETWIYLARCHRFMGVVAGKTDAAAAQKCFNEALAAAEESISLGPQAGVCYFEKGMALVNMNKGPEARPFLLKAAQLQPTLAPEVDKILKGEGR